MLHSTNSVFNDRNMLKTNIVNDVLQIYLKISTSHTSSERLFENEKFMTPVKFCLFINKIMKYKIV